MPRLKERLKENAGLLAAIAVTALGLAGMKYLGAHPLLLNISEALFIAGVLSFTVDQFLKRDLLREASRGIFIHLLGFEHHPQVKDKLRDIIFETKLLRTRFDLRCEIEPRDGYFLFTVEYSTEVINPTNTPVEWRPYMEFDEAHKVKVLEMSLTATDGSCCWKNTNPATSEVEPGVEGVMPESFNIKPMSKGVTYHGSGKYVIKVLPGYSQFHMGIPTLATSIRVIAPEDYQVEASKGGVRNGNYWEYNSIKMVGDHLTVRWRKIGGEWL